MYGELVKLKIISYSKEDTGEGDKTLEFEVQINPGQFKRTYRIAYENQSPRGDLAKPSKFKLVEPEELDLEFTIDGTGVVRNDAQIGGGITGTAKAIADTFSNPEKNTYVIDQINKLKSVVYAFISSEHRTPFVKVIWGDDIFTGMLVNMDITYTLFNPDGLPLRAKINASFRQQIPRSKQETEKELQSPDVTHSRIVKEGDNILLLTHHIYNDPAYYLEVARTNKLTNFRKLKTGKQIQFPPFKKTE